MSNKNLNFQTAVVMPNKAQQESFNKVCSVRKMMKLYPNMSLRTACANNSIDYKTYKKYLDFVTKIEGLL